MRIIVLFIFFIVGSLQISFAQAVSSTSPHLALNTEIEKKVIVVYGSDTCHYCIETKQYLKENKIDFMYYDVDIDLDKQNEMIIKLQNAGIDLSSLSLPVIDKKGIMYQNNPTQFKAFLKVITN
ncbi:glutaredoxin family protein [Algibacter pacificus]|uniref:glutaredoxin family protein n=1 Tax=Algibacter pacificus TaxID=2599389 RepID=UPI0011CB57EB|nr:glutaredoxin family protein [Algibacter pacificus]